MEKLRMIGPPSIPLYRGDIVWDRRKTHWNLVAERTVRVFGREFIASSDGRKIPAAHAEHDTERRERELRERELAELARLQAKYPESAQCHPQEPKA